MEMTGEGPERPAVATNSVADGVKTRARHSRLMRVLAGCLAVVAGLGVVLALFIASLLYFNIESNPLVGRFVRDRLVAPLQDRIDPALRIGIETVDLKRESSETLVNIAGFSIQNAAGNALVVAPTGTVTLDTAALMAMRLVPRDVQLAGLQIAVDLAEDGKVIVGAPAAGMPAAASPATPETAAGEAALSRMQALIGAAFGGLSMAREAVGGQLPEVGLKDASVVINDRRTGRQYALAGISSVLRTGADGAANAQFDVKAGDVAFGLRLEMSPMSEGRQSFAGKTESLHLAEVLKVLGIDAPGLEGAAPVNVTVTAEVDGRMKARAASAGITIGKLRIDTGLPEAVTDIDEISAAISWREGQTTIAVPNVAVQAGPVRFAMNGDIAPPAARTENWKLRLAGKDQTLPGYARADKPVALSDITLNLALDAVTGKVQIEQASIAGPQVQAEARGEMIIDDAGRPGLKLDLTARNTDARTALRIWPSFVAPKTRGWLADHVQGGQMSELLINLDFSPDVMARALGEKPIPEASFTLRFAGTKGAMQPLKGVPPLRDLVVSGHVTGRTARIDLAGGNIDAGPGRRITLSDSQFWVADTSKKPPDARLRLKFVGNADAVAELLRAPGLAQFAPKVMDPALVRGTVDGEINVQLRLNEVVNPAEVRTAIVANLRNITLEKVQALDRIEGGNFLLTTDRENVTLKGDARIFGTPATVEMRGAGKSQAVMTIGLTLDDAARARKGITLGAALAGPIAVKLTAPLVDGEPRDVIAELDLTRAGLTDLVPGWSKKAGVPGKLRARVTNGEGGGWLLDRLELDAGTLLARGAINVGADGAFQKAQLSSFKLSPGDNVQVDADRTGGLTRINLKGNAFDARPFLRSLQTGTIDKAGAKDTEITLKTTVLSGFGGELVSNADLKLTLRGSDLRRFDLSGRFDQGPITTKLQVRGNQPPVLTVESDDAGAFLRFFDIYSRMRGGSLLLTVAIGSGGQSGNIMVHDFHLRNEPAMKRLVADVTNSAVTDSTRIAPEVARRLANTQDVPFTKMTASFVRTPGRLDVKEAVMWGPEIGGSISGMLDYVRDRVDLTGTFVPAYSLNNMFSQVPVLGPLLGGGRNEGLFAVRYNINGRASAPNLSINPLTVIAPGFLRKLIDLRGGEGNPPAARPEQ